MTGVNEWIAAAPGLGAAFEGRERAGEVADLARTAEAGGAGTIWAANHLFQRDPVVQSFAALAATSRLRTALMAVSPYVVHPVQIAMAAATLDEHFPGRAVLSVGAGAPGDLDAAGVERTAPLATLRETMAVTRALLAGETVAHEGERLRVAGRALENGPRAVPIVLAATGPKMLRLAGAEADGVLLSAATSVEFVRWCLGEADEGGKGRRIRHVGLVFASVDEDERVAYDRLRRLLAFILRGAHHRPNLEMAGVSLDQEAVYAAVGRGDWDAAAALVSDEVVARHTVSGTPDQVRARIAEYRAAGLDDVVIAGVHGADHLRTLLEAAGDGGADSTEDRKE